MNSKFLNIENGVKTAIANIPLLPFNEFYEESLNLLKNGAFVVQYFGYKESEQIKIVAVLRTDKLWIASAIAPKEYPALTCHYPAFNVFERELAEQYAIKPIGHPWLKSVRYHANYVADNDVFGNDYSKTIPAHYPFFEVKGEEIHQVAVGPIHAGVIEPGHFRFNCFGEKVLHLEIQLGYQHRGVERQLVKSAFKKLPVIIESIAGDTAIAQSIAFSEAIEGLADLKVDEDYQKIRAIVLELERIANHVGDLGALSGDIAFLPPSAYFGRMRGDFLNLLLKISGNRFGKGLVRPGGTRFAINSTQKIGFLNELEQLKKEIFHVGDLLFSQPGVLERFEETGIVDNKTAIELGLVGPAARACELDYDVRRSFPTNFWKTNNYKAIIEASGDVMARASVRYREIKKSLKIIENILNDIDGEKDIKISAEEPRLAPNHLILTLQEAWRGELSHCIITDSTGKIIRYKIKDPSFHNWNGLAMAMRNGAISDFPLCNKSFNLSYCGFDL